MVVRSDLGKGLVMPTDPHQTYTILQSSSSQPQKTYKYSKPTRKVTQVPQPSDPIEHVVDDTVHKELGDSLKPRKPKKKDTKVPQPSGSTDNVVDEAVHKELGDSLVRAATTAFSLEVEQDSGNINRTQSKATPNELSSQGTSSDDGPRCQEATRDTIAQTRFDNASKISNDSLLARGNTLQSDEDKMKLNELMELCTNLQTRVIDLEKTKTTQPNEIDSLKRKVKKLERRNKSRTHKIKRLYKVGLTTRVESSDNEESLGEDTSKQRRIEAIDVDEDITPVNVQADADKDLGGEEVFVEQEAVADKEKIDEVTLAQALAELKTSKPKDDVQANIDDDHQLAERLQAKEQQELTDEEKATLFMQFLEKKRKFFAAKKAEEKRNKPPTQAQKRKIMVNTFEDFKTKLVQGQEKEKRAGEELIQKRAKNQKVEDEKETTKLKQLMEIIPDKEEVAIDDIPLAVKSLGIVNWKIYKEGKKIYYQIIRVDGKSKMYMFFSQILESFDREDLEDF
nr:hypothetical protein [Tanacetum cinerariifolium]